jgi:L-lactate dehydrogenase complex protein LldG
MSFASKENILSKIRQALVVETPIPFPNAAIPVSIYQPLKQEIEIEFAENFIQLQGKFVYCTSTTELAIKLNELFVAQKWKNIYCLENSLLAMLSQEKVQGINPKASVSNCQASITSCEALVARLGSILLSSATQSGREASVYAPIHICIAYTNQIVYDIADAFNLLKEKYGSKMPSVISLATGPSRTADIEKTLVVGVHGPKEVYCFLVEP